VGKRALSSPTPQPRTTCQERASSPGLNALMATRSQIIITRLAVTAGDISKADAEAALAACRDLAAAGTELRMEDWLVGQGKLSPTRLAELRAMAEGLPPPKPKGVPIETARRIPIYEVHDKIGEGGMATVFSAYHRETGQPRALKVLFPEHAHNPAFVARFVREGKLLKAFDCENIVRGYEYGRAGKEVYFMGMELIQGESLQDMLEREGPFTEQKALHCITSAARALAYMQASGIVHRDIKPDNIMWHQDGRIMLVDLGFAKPIQSDNGPNAEFEDETCGTVQYISPEQARGRADVDIRADIYSLGATLYHLVFGELPFQGKDSGEVMAKQVMESLDAHRLKGGRISMHMHYFIEKMMAKDREVRYQSAQEVVDDIEEVLQGAADLIYDPSNETLADPFTALSQRVSAISGRSPAQRSTRMAPPRSVQTSARFPVAGPGTSVRIAQTPSSGQPPASGNGKQVRMPAPRKRGGAGETTQIRPLDPTRAKPSKG
jgi:serine/threonine protein kinase